MVRLKSERNQFFGPKLDPTTPTTPKLQNIHILPTVGRKKLVDRRVKNIVGHNKPGITVIDKK